MKKYLYIILFILCIGISLADDYYYNVTNININDISTYFNPNQGIEIYDGNQYESNNTYSIRNIEGGGSGDNTHTFQTNITVLPNELANFTFWIYVNSTVNKDLSFVLDDSDNDRCGPEISRSFADGNLWYYNGTTNINSGEKFPLDVYFPITIEYNFSSKIYNLYINDTVLIKDNLNFRALSDCNKLNTFDYSQPSGTLKSIIFIGQWLVNNIAGPEDNTPTITIVYPTVNFTNDNPTTFTINVTNPVDTSYNCTLSNETEVLDEDTVTKEVNTDLTFVTTDQISSNTYTIQCNDSYGNSGTETYFLEIDTVNPTLTITYPTIALSFENDTYTNFSAYDTNLYSFMINITNSTGTKYSEYNNTVYPSTSIDILRTYNTTSWEEGDFNHSIEVCDGHTSTSLKDDYNVIKDNINNKITYSSPENVISVKSTSLQTVNFMNSYELSDRHSFYYVYQDTGKEETYTWRLTSSLPLNYLPSEKYKAWFVTGKKWIDFNTANIGDSYNVQKIDDYNYDISITTTNDEFNFQSIGELNCISDSRTITKELIIPPIIPSDNIPLQGIITLIGVGAIAIFMIKYILGGGKTK